MAQLTHPAGGPHEDTAKLAQDAQVDPGALFGQIAVERGLATERQVQAAMELQGRLKEAGSDLPLGEILAGLGSIDVYRISEVLSLQAFAIVRAEDKLFGRLAVRNKFASTQQVDDALAEQDRRARKGPPFRRLGEILVEQGALKVDDVKTILAAQTRLDPDTGRRSIDFIPTPVKPTDYDLEAAEQRLRARAVAIPRNLRRLAMDLAALQRKLEVRAASIAARIADKARAAAAAAAPPPAPPPAPVAAAPPVASVAPAPAVVAPVAPGVPPEAFAVATTSLDAAAPPPEPRKKSRREGSDRKRDIVDLSQAVDLPGGAPALADDPPPPPLPALPPVAAPADGAAARGTLLTEADLDPLPPARSEPRRQPVPVERQQEMLDLALDGGKGPVWTPPAPPPPPAAAVPAARPAAPQASSGQVRSASRSTYMSFEEVIDYLAIDEDELTMLVAEAKLRGVKDGPSMKFDREEVAAMKKAGVRR